MNQTQVKWADYTQLDEENYLMLTKELYNIENELGKDIHNSIHPSRRFEYPWVYSKLQPLNDNDKVLDVGSGDTVLQFLVSRQVKELHSIDTDSSAVDWISKTCKTKNFVNIFPSRANIFSLPFMSDCFDKVTCISVLEHLPKEQVWSAIEELTRVVKPHGRLAITMDVVLEETDKQVDINDFMSLAEEHLIPVPQFPNTLMRFSTPPYNFPFTVCCILIQKDGI